MYTHISKINYIYIYIYLIIITLIDNNGYRISLIVLINRIIHIKLKWKSNKNIEIDVEGTLFSR